MELHAQKEVILQRDMIAYVIKVKAIVLDGLGIPRYSLEFANRPYYDHLKISLLVVKQYLDVSYRGLYSTISLLKV